ncbi:hypothetical protein DENIS_3296 [Desulfonema ishimotonii]|uniref:Response regulatory domain-containing protein n=1 Tax=Desulfonema ishimotonii TaxID=45657 RepID=A0A401FZF0_9BACT|nr:response regulator transcription factor [Desulfonema ishimotonii]GBC62327.1 hypothetical protein DENIS_3296 [Desulfonema ishimotonii]
MGKMLIVEDSATFRQTFRKALGHRFPEMEIAEAENGEQALDIIETFKPDIVFMDIRLPGENGLALTGRIKIGHPNIFVIILTEYDLPEYRAAAFKNGADDFITKGALNMSQLVAMVNKMMPEKNRYDQK